MFEFETLGILIRLRRQERNLSQERLSRLAGISRRQLFMMEEGRNFSLSYLVKVATALDLTELPLEGLRLRAAPPELAVLVRAADAVAIAERAIGQVAEATEQLSSVSKDLGGLIDRALSSAGPTEAITEAARRLKSRPAADRDRAAAGLREAALEDPHRPKRAAATTTAPVARRRAR